MKTQYLYLLGLTLAPMTALAQDSDGDGVGNSADTHPCDTSRASVTYFPSQNSSALLAFEDQWPGSTDLDYNDVAVRVHYRLERNVAGNAVQLHAVFDPVAVGGELSNGLGLQLPTARAGVTARRRIGGGAWETLTLESDANVTLVLSNNLRELYGNAAGRINSLPGQTRVNGQRLELEVTFATAAALAQAEAPFDVFIFRSGSSPRHEIHFPQYLGTASMNGALFNTLEDGSTATRRFVHNSGVPAALNLMTTTRYPLEGVQVSALFPDIIGFAHSAGANNTNFYANNVVSAQGHDVAAAVLPAVAMPDTTCLAGPTQAEAARLLAQASFGATDSLIAAVQVAGINGWISQQMNLPMPSQSHQTYLENRLAQLVAANPSATLSSNHFYESWWRQAVTEPGQLRQRVAFAYSQIFVIGFGDNIDIRGAGSYYDMLARHAFGNFRALLEEISLHPMMGRYLTYLANQREDAAGTRTPDENYAREVMQLFTIGLFQLNPDGSVQMDANGEPLVSYTQADISGLARVFTGLSWYHPTPTNSTFGGSNRDPSREVRSMSFYPQYHSISAKTFLGLTIPANATADVAGDLRIALDTLFNHPNVGPFLALRLIQQMVTSNPSPGYVGRVAAAFNNNGAGVRGDMGAVIRAVLSDPEARDPAYTTDAAFGKLREPVIRMTHWMRAFGATSASGSWLMVSTSSNQSLAQSPLTSPSVFNFWRPDFIPPATTELGLRNLLAPEFQVVDEVSVAGYLNTIQTTIDLGIGTSRDVRATYAAELALANDPSALVERMNLLLLSGAMGTTLRQQITDAVAAIAVTGTQSQMDTARLNRVKTAIFFTMASPEYLAQR